ncbi:MAG: hypothetical protein ABEK59_11775 [Halobacteria archaeon]
MIFGMEMLFERSLTAILIIAYLFYEIHHGRVEVFAEKLDTTIDAVVALARESENIDEEKYVEEVNGDMPARYIQEKQKVREDE